MVQPVEGLVVSIPVLVDAQCMKRQPPSAQQKLLDLCPEIAAKGKDGSAERRVADLPRTATGKVLKRMLTTNAASQSAK